MGLQSIYSCYSFAKLDRLELKVVWIGFHVKTFIIISDWYKKIH